MGAFDKYLLKLSKAQSTHCRLCISSTENLQSFTTDLKNLYEDVTKLKVNKPLIFFDCKQNTTKKNYMMIPNLDKLHE